MSGSSLRREVPVALPPHERVERALPVVVIVALAAAISFVIVGVALRRYDDRSPPSRVRSGAVGDGAISNVATGISSLGSSSTTLEGNLWISGGTGQLTHYATTGGIVCDDDQLSLAALAFYGCPRITAVQSGQVIEYVRTTSPAR